MLLHSGAVADHGSPGISPLNHLEVPILPEDLSEGVLEGELIEAAFAICFPNQKCTTFR